MRRIGAVVSAGMAGLAGVLATSTSWAEYGLNMTRGVTDISHEVYGLHMLIFYICCVIGVVVFGAMIYSMMKHRKSKGHKPATFHESTTVEIVWTVIPFVILIAMAVPAAKTLIAMENTADADVTIKVTGYQWKWQYEYLDGDAAGISFFSNLSTPREQIQNQQEKGEHYLLEVDNPLVLPTGKKVRFLLTANDVIHAWWVPDLAVKKDAVPGFINEMWTRINEEGVYRGQCAELCGRDHGFMPIEVVALEESKYLDWVAEQKGAKDLAAVNADREWSKDELMAKGEEVYKKNCAACHMANGAGVAGAFPAITDSPVVLGMARIHVDTVMNGRAGTAMQGFAAQLNDADMASVITYQRNALGNSVGDVIQPAAIKAIRK